MGARSDRWPRQPLQQQITAKREKSSSHDDSTPRSWDWEWDENDLGRGGSVRGGGKRKGTGQEVGEGAAQGDEARRNKRVSTHRRSDGIGKPVP